MDALEYKQSSKPPKGFIQYKPISEQPSSIKDISYSLKDYGKTQELQKLLLNYECDIIKEVYVFDYFFNEKMKEIKMGFRFIFQSNESTLTAAQIDFIYNEIIEESLKINGITIPGL
jgi:phenylalanyl-tRNA synthetase beta subunit